MSSPKFVQRDGMRRVQPAAIGRTVLSRQTSKMDRPKDQTQLGRLAFALQNEIGAQRRTQFLDICKSLRIQVSTKLGGEAQVLGF